MSGKAEDSGKKGNEETQGNTKRHHDGCPVGGDDLQGEVEVAAILK